MAPALLPQTSAHRPPTVTLPPQSLPYPNFPETQVTQHPTNEPASCPRLPNADLSAKPPAIDYTPSPHTQAPAYLQPPTSVPQVSMYPDAVPQHTFLPPSYVQHMHAPLNAPVRATATSSLPPAAYGGFLQFHQVNNVQVFSGNADSKMLIEDWVRDMQYLLEAIEPTPPPTLLHCGMSPEVTHRAPWTH
ncbi:hypothetical protein D5F01_LYC06697 [Larimichthys crocea]|uniref:Uncharacterized protein n=1 Tax=Larimichthys crocea TaxID=215358 RepID=A0A6G0IR58_LARCR|nr:hypothetical protein D5F01_LYC06697 [Larimichthys crocea]